jgi:hypothetical protein
MSTAVSTKTMARVLGPVMLVMGGAVALRAETMPTLVEGLVNDAPLLLITGAFVLVLGAVMIGAHNVWNSPAAIVVSLLGWITLVRGALVLLAPNVVATIAPFVVHVSPAILAIGLVLALLGLWLGFVGWFTKSA